MRNFLAILEIVIEHNEQHGLYDNFHRTEYLHVLSGLAGTWFPAESMVEVMHDEATGNMPVQLIRSFTFAYSHRRRNKEIPISVRELLLLVSKVCFEGLSS